MTNYARFSELEVTVSYDLSYPTYPTDAITRVTGLKHSYQRGGTYRLEHYLGGLPNLSGLGLLGDQGGQRPFSRTEQRAALSALPAWQPPYQNVDDGFYKGPGPIEGAKTDPGFFPMRPGETLDDWAKRVTEDPYKGGMM